MRGRFALISAALCLSACASIPAQQEPSVAAIMAAGDTRPAADPVGNLAEIAGVPMVSSEQWLYGSAEAQVTMRQGWDSIATYGEYVAKNPPAAAVFLMNLSPEASLWDNCGGKPLAAVFDADETVIWNMGVTHYQSARGASYDPEIWDQWERTGADKVVAVPGAVAAFDRLRKAGLTIIINTNREAKNAAQTTAALAHAGLGTFTHGNTLYLKGDGVPAGERASSAKDGRRAMIAKDYCIVILAGDQLGDISDVFNAKGMTATERRTLANAPAFDSLWGKGWFILPNPVYGPWQNADFDDIYPAETRWTPQSGAPTTAAPNNEGK
jgi:5'-nucleotidase (lipoprotein e(P4) family)